MCVGMLVWLRVCERMNVCMGEGVRAISRQAHLTLRRNSSESRGKKDCGQVPENFTLP